MTSHKSMSPKNINLNWVLSEDIPQNINLVRQQALEALRRQIIPWLENQQVNSIILAEPPVMATSGVKILGYRPPLPRIPRLKHDYMHDYIWYKQHMAAPRYIGMGCVLEGEADLVFGTNVYTWIEGVAAPHKPGLEVLTFSQRSLFIMPPGVPRTTGDRPHWERSTPETAHSRIFWLLFRPSEVFCHICYTQGKKHGSDGVITIEDHHLEPIAQTILEELRTRSGGFDRVVRLLLLGLLCRVERDLSSEAIFPGRQAPLIIYTLPEVSLLVRSVCQFIQQHRREPLTLTGVASRYNISPSQLNRRFNAEIGMSVIDYLVHIRIEVAKYLLMTDLDEDQLPIHQVSHLAGFTDPSYFGRIFKQRVGMSPTQFRKHHRNMTSP